jgi:hypothetical protein
MEPNSFARQRRERPGDAAGANRLTPIRAFCRSARPSTHPQSGPVHNFFRGAKAAASGVIVRAMPRAEPHTRTRYRGASEKFKRYENPYFIGIFAQCRNFCAKLRK